MDNQTQEFTNFLFYTNNDGLLNVQIILGDETVWTTQKGMSEIFNVGVPAISKHLNNIFESNELEKDAVISKMETTASDGKNYQTNFYNLDAIISVGYRINSTKATQFRKWASSVLKEYLIKGFVLNDDRLKQGNQLFGKDYFSELLERIREIRASERRFYQKVTDIYSTAIDYDPKTQISKEFFAMVQNKLHWAIHGSTAAELISKRANSNKPNMGLTNWKNKKGKVLKSDTKVAKNYLSKDEISQLNRLVSMYLDFAENMASRNKAMKMVDWVKKLDSFLDFNEYDVLTHKGKTSMKRAEAKAKSEYMKFRVKQDEEFTSDFDNFVNDIIDRKRIASIDGMISQDERKAKIEKKIEEEPIKTFDLEEMRKKKLSNHNQSLKKALDYNPKNDKVKPKKTLSLKELSEQFEQSKKQKPE